MKAQLTVEVRIMQEGSYGNAFTLSDNYKIDLSSLHQFAEVLVKFHELADLVIKQYGVKP